MLAVPLVALIAVQSLSYVSGQRAGEATELVVHTLDVQSGVDEVRVLYLEATLGMRAYALTGSGDFLERYHYAIDRLPLALARLRSSIRADSARALLDDAEAAGERLLNVLERMEARARLGGTPADGWRSFVLETGDTLALVRVKLDAVDTREDRLLDERSARADRADRSRTLTMLISTAAGMLVGLAAMLLFARGLARRVHRNERNANRLAEGLPLFPSIPAGDEIGRVERALEAAAALLAERQAEVTESETRYRGLAKNFPGGAVAIFDHELRYVLVEGEALDALGMSKEDFEGRTIFEALGPEVASIVEAGYRAALRGERNASESKFGERWFFVQRVPLFDARGEVEAGLLVALDITDRKRAEEEVSHAEAFLESVVENIPNMVFVKEAEDLRFVRFNRAGEELLGYSRDDLVGRNDYDFFPREEADSFTSRDREVLEGGGVVDIEEEPIETKEKGLRILHTKKIPIVDESGTPRYLLGISEDITDRKRAEEAVRQARDEAEGANRAKDEFLSRMSHELRTPMNAVLGFAQLLEMGSLDEEQRDSVKRILHGGRHLLRLIDDVLDVSRIATGNLTLSLEPVSVTQAIREAAELIQPLASERGIELCAEDANGLHILADRQRLRQVLLNLLSNGVKYNREAGRVSVS